MKVLTVFLVSLVVYGLSLSSFIPGFSIANLSVYLASALLIVNAVLSVVLFICFFIVRWNKVEQAQSISEITGSWLRAIAFVAVLLFTIIFPSVAILFESLTHICAEMFDLIPTPLHFIVLALGPVLNGFCAGLLFQKVDIEPKTVNFLNGMAIGIALPFLILAVPFFALFAYVLISGTSWLVFSGMTAFFGSCELFNLLGVFYPSIKGFKTVRIMGIVVGFAMVVLVQVPTWLTNGFTNIAARNPDNKSAVQMIKLFGDRNYLLYKCYLSGNRSAINEIGLPRINPTDAQAVFKRVTGKDYKSIPKPERVEREEARMFRD